MKKIRIILLALMCIMFSLAAACSNSCSNGDDDADGGYFTLKEYQYELYVGESRNIETISDEELQYEYSSMRSDIATVDNNGLVEAVAKGVTFVTIKSGDYEDVLRVTVHENVKKIDLNIEDSNMVVNTSKTITATIYEKGVVSDAVVNWTVAPTCDYEINGNNITLKPSTVGHLTITASYGDITAVCNVKVVNEGASVLKAPDLKVEGCNTITWKAIVGADVYDVLVNDNEWVEITDTSYNIKDLSDKLLVGEIITVAVRAKANENFNYINSNINVIKVKHDFTETSIGETAYSCTIPGTIKYDCKNCDREYTVEEYLDAHDFEDGRCKDCKKVQSENVMYIYDEEKGEYGLAGVQANYSSDELYVLSEYDDGIHGLKPVTFVASKALGLNTMIKKVVLPESITLLQNECFSRMSSLEYLAMPGISYTGKPDGYDIWMDCYNLRTIIVADGFHNQSRNFFIHKWSPNEYVPILDVYVIGDSYSQLSGGGYPFGIITQVDATTKDGGNYMFTGNVYYYDETGTKCGQFWRFDEEGNVERSKDHVIRENVCVECGYIYNKDMIFQYIESDNAYALKRVRVGYTGEKMVIPEIYNDGIHGELPVKTVAVGAFALVKSLKTVVLPKTITTIYDSAFSDCTNLETLIMPGVTSMGGAINQFLNNAKLRTVVVSNTANISWQTFHVESSKFPAYAPQVDVYLYSDEDPCENLIYISINNNNMFTGNVYCRCTDYAKHGTWWDFDADGNVKKFENPHNFVDGWCDCGAKDDKGVSYAYSPSIDGYRVLGVYDRFNSNVLELDTYDDGVNGEKPVLEIASGAFRGNTKITELNFTKSVTTINANAFSAMPNLVTVRLPGVSSIGSSAFADCPSLKNIIVNPDLEMTEAAFTSTDNSRLAILSSESGIGSLNINFAVNTRLSGKIYYKKLDTMPSAYHENWWYESNGKFYLEEKGSHNFSNGNCSCGAWNPGNFSYAYDPLRGGYRLVSATLKNETKLTITTYSDGVHGELPIVSVGAKAFSASDKLTYLRFPIETVYIGKDALAQLTKLETIVMPGIQGSSWKSKTYLSNINSDVLKHIVLGDNFSISGFSSADGLFLNSNLKSPSADIKPEDVENNYRTADVFIFGTTVRDIDVTNNTAIKVYKNERYGGKAFFYSESPKADSWYFDEDGIPTMWEDKTYYAYDQSLGGYVLNTFANADIPADGRVIIPEKYNGTNGEHDVVAVADKAFSATEEIKYLKFPESVKKIGIDAIAGLTKLETLIMPGITGGLFGEKGTKNFNSDVNSDVLKHIVAGADSGFSISGTTSAHARFNNSNLQAPSSGANPEDVENKYRTADLYIYGTVSKDIDVTNNTALKVYTNTQYGGKAILYSKTPKAGYWDYNEDGIPTMWSDETYYAYDESLGGYVLTSFSNTEIPADGRVIIPEKYNDGTNGEHDVVAVADKAFSATEEIKYLKFPESVKKIGIDAIAGLTKLETLIMTGITGGTSGAKGSKNFGSDVNSDVLKHIVAGDGFSVSGYGDSATFNNSNVGVLGFGADPEDLNNQYRTAEVYIYGTTVKDIDVTNNTAIKVYKNERYGGKVILYSATEKVGYWHFDENYVPVMWEDKTSYELNATSDGYILTRFAESDAVEGKVIIPAEYEGSAGKLPVVAVGDNAFGTSNTITHVEFSKNVTYIGTDALSGLTALKTLIMPGITGSTYKSATFKTTVTSTALETVTAGAGFIVDSAAFHNSAGTNKAKLFWTSLPTFNLPNSTGTTNADRAYTSSLYHKPIGVDVANCKLLSGEAYGWNGSNYVLLNAVVLGDTFIVPEDLNDGVNGAGKLTEVAPIIGSHVSNSNGQGGVTKAQNTLVNLVLPDTVTKIHEDAFINYRALEILAMPGLTSSTDYTAGSRIWSEVLRIVVVGEGFNFIGASTNGWYNFVYEGSSALCKSKDIALFVAGDGSVVPESKSSQDAFTYNVDGTGIYYFSLEAKAYHWHYDKETKLPELYNINGSSYELNGEGTGYVLTAFVGVDKELKVDATYAGSAGELPVVAVGPNAFGANNTLETLILPKSVTLIDTDALSGLTALETLVMPGITGYTHNSTTFKTKVTSTALKTVTTGVGFIVDDAAFHNGEGTNQAKLFWAELPNLDVKNSSGTSTLNKDYTSWLYPKAIAVDVANCKLLSGEVYGYKEGVGYVIMSYVGNSDTFIAPEVINDGVHGEGQIKEALPLLGSYVSGSNNQSGHTKRQSTLKNLILPTSVNKVWENAFINYEALEVLAIPGLTTQQNYYLGSTISSTTLKVVVLGDGFEFIGASSYNNYNFAYDTGCKSQNVILFIAGSSAPVLKSSQNAFTYNTTNGTEGIYYYSETRLSGAWTYEKGIPTLWDDIP